MKDYRVTFHFEGLDKQQVEVKAESPVIALIRANELVNNLTLFKAHEARIVSIGEVLK